MYVLYLDKLNAKMEQMFLDHMPKRDDVEVHFLNPVNGEPGELSKADILIDTTFQVTSDVLKEASNCKLMCLAQSQRIFPFHIVPGLIACPLQNWRFPIFLRCTGESPLWRKKR